MVLTFTVGPYLPACNMSSLVVKVFMEVVENSRGTINDKLYV